MSETYNLGALFDEHVADFYDKHFVGHWPEDTEIIPVSRTVGTDTVVDEMVMCFTHDIPMNTFLPGVAPTGRPVVVVMGFESGKVAFERIYWDQACLLAQIGLIDETMLPVTGAAQAEKVLDKGMPANELLQRRG